MVRNKSKFSSRRTRSTRYFKSCMSICMALAVQFARLATPGGPASEMLRSQRQLQSFVEGCVFSEQAATPARIANTLNVIKAHSLPSASDFCEDSSGKMRIVEFKRISKMCWYANDYLRVLRRVPSESGREDFIVCDRDCRQADADVISIAKSRRVVNSSNRTVTVLPVNVGRHFQWVPYALRDPWAYKRKLPIALWRGVSTGDCWGSVSKNAIPSPNCARRNLVFMWSSTASLKIDVGLTNIVQVPPEVSKMLQPLQKERMSVKDIIKYRYIISVEGNDVATNLKWALASNSVVFMPPATKESFILESRLIPWVHYVPINYTTTDLEEKIEFCDQNEVLCEGIARASTEFMHTFSTRRKLFHLGALVYQRHFEKMAESYIWSRSV